MHQSIFEYEDYKSWVNDWVQSQPRQGYGLFSKMAVALGTSTAAVSQTFRGNRDLNLEQAAKLAQFMSLGNLEGDFFLLLVQHARAGTHHLKTMLNRQLTELRSRGQSIKNRIVHKELTDTDKATFYSHWSYMAVWLAAPIRGYSSVSALSKRFRVSEETASTALLFLLEKGLLVRKENRIEFGKNVVHVPDHSPFVLKHHMNWRMKALSSMDQRNPANLHYSAPMSLSAELVPEIREELIQLIQKQTKRVAASPSEALMCLNIDWFEY